MEGATIRLPAVWMRRLDVESILELSYLFHVANDLDATKFEAEMAMETVNRFRIMTSTAKSGTAAGIMSVTALAVIEAHGRAISREKNQWRKRLQDANDEKSRHEEKFKDASGRSILMGTFWKFLGPIIMALFGYIMSLFLGDVIPTRSANQTDSDAPTLLIMFASMFIGRQIGVRWRDYERDHIVSVYSEQVRLADEIYQTAKEAEFERYRARLCGVWKQLTGEEYPDTLSYEVVTNIHRRSRDRIETARLIHGEGAIKKVWRWYQERRKVQKTVIALSPAKQQT